MRYCTRTAVPLVLWLAPFVDALVAFPQRMEEELPPLLPSPSPALSELVEAATPTSDAADDLRTQSPRSSSQHMLAGAFPGGRGVRPAASFAAFLLMRGGRRSTQRLSPCPNRFARGGRVCERKSTEMGHMV